MSHEHDHDQGHIGIGIDARLRRALIHAPDASVEPSAALDESILRAAHAAVPKAAAAAATRESKVSVGWLRRWWAHPAVAPAFAVAALSTVIVSMWTQHGVPPTMTDDEGSRVAAAPTREPRELANGSPAQAGGDVGAARNADADTALRSTAPTSVTAAPVAAARDQAAIDAVTEAKTQSSAASPAPVQAPAPVLAPAPAQKSAKAIRAVPEQPALAAKRTDTAPQRKEAAPGARQANETDRRIAERAESMLPTKPAAPADRLREAAGKAAPPAPPQPSPLDKSQTRQESAVASRAAAMPADASAPAVAPAAAAGSVASNLAPPPAAAPGRDASLEARLASADAPPLARAFESGASWQWRSNPSQPPADVDARARAWLARLTAASQGRWVRSDREATPQRSANARTVELWREQSSWATIVVGAADVTWFDATGRGWRAPLAADTLAELRGP